MRTLKFYGCSDDLFEVSGTIRGEPNEIGAYNSPIVVEIVSEEGKIRIVGEYGVSNGCWMIGILPAEEDVEIPQWKTTWGLYSNGYSTQLTMEVPDDAKVKQVYPPFY